MLTVTELATHFKLSRTAVLYYERVGLLTPHHRSENGYRWYGDPEIERLKHILAYRSFGIPVADIAPLLNKSNAASQQQILKDQFNNLEREINQLRKQQEAIVATLKEPDMLENNMLSKSRWVAIMKASGFDENDMTNWHRNFESMEPEEHHKFLESLGIDEDEIKHIRQK